MPGKRASEAGKRQFWALVAQGVSPAEAARQIGMSRGWGWRMTKGILPSKTMAQYERLENAQPAPKPYTELSDEAKLMLDFDRGFPIFCGELLMRASVPWRTDAAKRVVEALMDPKRSYIVANEPPGSGKSTLFTMDIPAWLICGGGLADPIRGRALRIMLGSYGMSVATKYVRRLRNFLESPFPYYDKQTHITADFNVVNLYGRFKPRQPGLPWRESDFIVEQFAEIDLSEKESTVQAASREKGFLGERYDFYSWDDLVVSANTRNAEIRESTAEWFADEAETRLEPGGVGMLVGQRLGPGDLYRNRLDVAYVDTDGAKRKKYTHIVYPAHDDKGCDGDHRQHYEGSGCLLDSYRLPFSELEQHRQANPRKYRTLYQQEDVDPAGSLIDGAWLTGGIDHEGFTRPGCYDEDRGFLQWPSDVPNLIDYVTIDPAAGGYWGIEWWAYDHESRMRWLINGIRSRDFDGGKLLQYDDHGKLTGLMQTWQEQSVQMGHRIQVWVMEGNGAFKHLVNYGHFKVWQRHWRTNFILHRTGINKNDEQQGVTELLPALYRAGLKRIPRGDPEAHRFAKEFEKELTQYPEGVTWDLVMADWFGEWNIERIRLAARLASQDHTDEPPLPPYLARQRIEVATR